MRKDLAHELVLEFDKQPRVVLVAALGYSLLQHVTAIIVNALERVMQCNWHHHWVTTTGWYVCSTNKIPPLVREIYSFVESAQKNAIKKIKANVTASSVDYEARNYLKNQQLDKFFGHSLGHGVGLEIHEAPSLSHRSPSILKENMVVTVEPAVYLPNKFGIRIEDMVLITQKGCEVLSGNNDL